MTLQQAEHILGHLLRNGAGYCYLMDGRVVTRGDCYDIIKESKVNND